MRTAGRLDRDVRLHLYEAFVRTGRPPSTAETAAALGLLIAEVEASYERLADAHVIVLEPGTLDVWMANPLSSRPTPFVAEVGGRELFGNCIWDGLGVIAMLGGTGRVRTACPDCDEPLALDVRDRVLRPTDGVVHFAVPAAQWWQDIGYT